MTAPLKDRVSALEQQVKDLTATVEGGPPKDAWRRTFGTSADDEGFDEMNRLGRAFRRKQNRIGTTRAGS
jgi:hypothetical protein